MVWAALLFLILAGLFAGLVLARRRLSRNALIGAGIGFAAIGFAPLAVLEWQYSEPKTTPVTMPVALDRATTVRTRPFTVAHSGPYELWLVFDRADDTADFDCWTGYHDMEAACPRGDPALDIGWKVSEQDFVLAQGGSDWRAWGARQAALPPAAMAKARRDFLDYEAKTADPANRWPLYAEIGRFDAARGATYVVALTVRKPGGPLARLHPRLVIGLGEAATKGLGALAVAMAVVWSLAGGLLVLMGLARTKDA